MSKEIIFMPTYLNSKDCILNMEKDSAITWWFYLNDRVMAIDYLPTNSPVLEIVVFSSIIEAYRRKREMIKNEGWSVIVDDFFNHDEAENKTKNNKISIFE